MAGLARQKRQQLLQTLVGFPAYAALNAGDPGDSAAFVVEPTIGANGYARQAITWNNVSVPIADGDAVLSNQFTLTFTSTGIWNATAALSFITVWTGTSSTSEINFVGSCALKDARLVDRAGIVITLPPGALTLSIGLEE